MAIPREYKQILDDVSDDDFFERTQAMSPDEIDASLKRSGFTDEMLATGLTRERQRVAESMGKKLIERLCWMTRAERDAWLAGWIEPETATETADEIRSIWAQALEELAAAGKPSPKLRAELDAEPKRAATGTATAEQRATAFYRRDLPDLGASEETETETE